MKTLILAGLLAVGLVGCGGNQGEAAASEPPGTTSQYSMRVSGPENTYLTIEARWRGGFGGAAHNDYTLCYVRERNWWQEDERRELQHWIGPKGAWNGGPVLRRIDADTIAVEMRSEYGKVVTSKYAFKGPWLN